MYFLKGFMSNPILSFRASYTCRSKDALPCKQVPRLYFTQACFFLVYILPSYMWGCPGPQYSWCPTSAFWSAFPSKLYLLSCPRKENKTVKADTRTDTKPDAVTLYVITNGIIWTYKQFCYFLTHVLHCPFALTPDQSWPPIHWGRSGLTLCAGGSVEPILGRFLGSPLLWVHARSSRVTPAALTFQQQRVKTTGSNEHLNERWVIF